MNRKEWNGREVTFGDFDLKQGRAVRAALAKGDGETAFYMALAFSMRYADTSELVFQSLDEVWGLPNRLYQRAVYLAGEALTVNGFATQEPASEVKPNGHDPEAARPSP
jgi:hypothetical protein